MNQYKELYRSLSNSDLLRIVGSPGDYQPLAIEAAKNELAERQLTPAELASANAENELHQINKQAEIERKRALENILKTTFFSMGDIIRQPQPKRKIIIIISIIFSLMFFVQFISLFRLMKFMFTNDSAIWDLPMVIYLSLLLSIPIGLLLFWLRKKVGWIILSVYITYSVCYSVITLFELTLMQYSGNSTNYNFFPHMSFLLFFFKIFFFAGMLWAMCRNDIRNDYHIDKRTMFISIGLSVSMTVLLYSAHYLI